MSIEATAWALSVEDVPDSTARVILLGLANHADREGRAAWPSVATLAEYAVCSERTAHRRLRDLEELGLIRRGDQRLVDHLPGNRRPVVYDLPVGVTRWQVGRGDNLAGVTPGAARGDTGGNPGVTPVADKPSLEPSMNRPTPLSPPGGEQTELLAAPEPGPAAADGYPDSFEDAWAAWPKRRTDTAGKKAAHAAWHRAVVGTAKRKPRTTAGTILDAVKAYAADPNLPPEQYMPNMTTWLNGDRWENGPLPPRGGGSGRPAAGDTHRAMERSLTASERYRQLEENGYQPPQQQAPQIEARRTA